MVQMLKSKRYFELFGGLNPGTVRVSTENSKYKVLLGRCAIFRTATAVFTIIYLLLHIIGADSVTPLANFSDPVYHFMGELRESVAGSV